jgi:Transmembrane amino acid transporter protein
VTYTVTAGKGLRRIEELATDDMHVNLTKYIFLFGAVQIGLSQIGTFAQLWWVSLVGAAMSVCYSVLAGLAALTAANDAAPLRTFDRSADTHGWAYVRGIFNALGAVTFAYGGHSVLLEIQATLRVPPPPRSNMMKGADHPFHCLQMGSPEWCSEWPAPCCNCSTDGKAGPWGPMRIQVFIWPMQSQAVATSSSPSPCAASRLQQAPACCIMTHP